MVVGHFASAAVGGIQGGLGTLQHRNRIVLGRHLHDTDAQRQPQRRAVWQGGGLAELFLQPLRHADRFGQSDGGQQQGEAAGTVAAGHFSRAKQGRKEAGRRLRGSHAQHRTKFPVARAILIDLDQQDREGRPSLFPLRRAVSHLLAECGAAGQVGEHAQVQGPGDVGFAFRGPALRGGAWLAAILRFARRGLRRKLRRGRGKRRFLARGKAGDMLAVVAENAIAAGCFSGIQGLVGPAEQVVALEAAWRRGDPEADRKLTKFRARRAENGLRDRRAGPLGGLAGFVQVCFRKDDRKLFTAIAGHQVHLAHLASQQFGYGTQHLVTRRVSVRVVELLELVDIGHDHGEGPTMAGELGKAAVQFVIECAAVGQERERVRMGLGRIGLHLMRLLAEFLLGRGQLRLHALVRLHQPGDHVDQFLRLVLADRRKLLVDLLNLAAVLLNVTRRLGRQSLQSHEDLRGVDERSGGIIGFRAALRTCAVAETGPPKPRRTRRPDQDGSKQVGQVDKQRCHFLSSPFASLVLRKIVHVSRQV